jgi:hypothetical protein
VKTKDPNVEQAEIQGVMRAYHDAMVAADIPTLEGVLDPAFTLTHITGYVQPRQEWLKVVMQGDFDYHAIQLEGPTVAIKLAGDAASLAGRGIFDATINGAHLPWRLQFTLHFERTGRTWRIRQARYSTF